MPFLRNRRDAEFRREAMGGELDTVAGFLADQLLGEWGFGSDDQDFGSFDVNLQPATFWAEKIKGALASQFQLHQRGEIDGSVFPELPKFESLVRGERLLGLGGQSSL